MSLGARFIAVLSILSRWQLCRAWVTQMPWYDQWKQKTDMYKLPNGKLMRLPLRLHSHESVLTGTADTEAVRASFTGEYYTPVTVGGKAVVQIWLNNFTDTDCGNADTRNPYLETWTSTWVTPKDQPLDLPYKNDMSYLIQDPRAIIWIHRVICADYPGLPTTENDPALGAILGGHNVWGFPKHPVKAKIQYEYKGSDRVDFYAQHLGMFYAVGPQHYVESIHVSMALPEKDKANLVVPVNVRTASDGVIGGPLNIVQQIRFGEAFNVTQNIAPWNASTDKLEFGTDEYYSSVLRAWKFTPKLKMHTDDFQIVAFKPANWLPPNASEVVVV